MTELEKVLKDINKKFGDEQSTVVQFGVKNLESGGTLSLGSPSLDFCLYNSLPEGKMIEISGAESSGKTTLSFLIASDYIKKELERHPDNPRHILFVDAECSADPEWAKQSTGYDMNDDRVKTLFIQPIGQSAEEIFEMVMQVAKTGQVGLIIFDSLTSIAPMHLTENDMLKKDMGGIAKPLGDFCKKITGILNRYHTTFIGINGVTENISGYGDFEITPGGRTWKRACMVRLRTKRGDFFDEDGNKLNKNAESPAGHEIIVAVLKTKVCRWDRKLAKLSLNYTKGVDLLADTIDVAIHFGMVDNYTQGMFRFIDVDTGEILCDDSGNEIKIRGKKNVSQYLKDHLDLWRKIYDAVYEKLSVKEPSNIIAFEQMLGTNIQEVLGFNPEDIDEEKI